MHFCYSNGRGIMYNSSKEAESALKTLTSMMDALVRISEFTVSVVMSVCFVCVNMFCCFPIVVYYSL